MSVKHLDKYLAHAKQYIFKEINVIMHICTILLSVSFGILLFFFPLLLINYTPLHIIYIIQWQSTQHSHKMNRERITVTILKLKEKYFYILKKIS